MYIKVSQMETLDRILKGAQAEPSSFGLNIDQKKFWPPRLTGSITTRNQWEVAWFSSKIVRVSAYFDLCSLVWSYTVFSLMTKVSCLVPFYLLVPKYSFSTAFRSLFDLFPVKKSLCIKNCIWFQVNSDTFNYWDWNSF